jgi:superfamily II DNA/RNA helicase
MQGFKRNQFKVLIATDVASRGLDIKNLQTVINYDVAANIDSHVHRIGRTGRKGQVSDLDNATTNFDSSCSSLSLPNESNCASNSIYDASATQPSLSAQTALMRMESSLPIRPTAHTLLLKTESKFAGLLVDNFEANNIPVTPMLLQLASDFKPWLSQRRRINSNSCTEVQSYSNSYSPHQVRHADDYKSNVRSEIKQSKSYETDSAGIGQRTLPESNHEHYTPAVDKHHHNLTSSLLCHGRVTSVASKNAAQQKFQAAFVPATSSSLSTNAPTVHANLYEANNIHHAVDMDNKPTKKSRWS